jgi:sec-independent protein translocase protein TatA
VGYERIEMALELTTLFVGGMPGGMELAVILLIAVLLFGANKIPKLARSTGEAMGEFKKGRQEVEDELKEMQEGGAPPSTEPDAGRPPADADSEPTNVEAEAETTSEVDAEVEAETADDET